MKLFQIDQIKHLYDTNQNKPLYSSVSFDGDSGSTVMGLNSTSKGNKHQHTDYLAV